MCDVLGLLKQSENGLTQDELVEKAKTEGIKDPFAELGTLIVKGVARLDESPKPPRFKATKAAWS